MSLFALAFVTLAQFSPAVCDSWQRDVIDGEQVVQCLSSETGTPGNQLNATLAISVIEATSMECY